MSTEQNQISQFINTIQIVLYLLHNVITENTKVIGHNSNWVHLQYLETYIKKISPELNIGLKASKEFQLFK